MSPRSSSTSPSSPAPNETAPSPNASPDPTPRTRVVLAGWTLAFLVLLDAAVNVVFRYPQDPRVTDPSRLQTYFEYGRSIEGKFAAKTRPTEEESAPILSAGWLRRPADEPLANGPSRREAGRRMLISLYGMSHAGRLAEGLKRTAKDVSVRYAIGPGASPNWTYAAFSEDHSKVEADAMVFALLSPTVPLARTMTSATGLFDMGIPYTAPSYSIRPNGELHRTDPEFLSVAGYRKAFADPVLWSAFRDQLAELDPFYDPLLFRASWLDSSALIRVLRRGYSISSKRRRVDKVYQPSGFITSSPEVRLIRRFAEEFARTSRSQGAVPVVFLANTFDYRDGLSQVMRPTLEQLNIPVLDSNAICPATRPSCYLPDSHFTAEQDDRMARELVRIIDNVRRPK